MSVKMVMGSWMLSSICETISPSNGEAIRKIMSVAGTMVNSTPALEWLSAISYGSAKMPAKIVPPAMPAVMLEESPANSSATAKHQAGRVTQQRREHRLGLRQIGHDRAAAKKRRGRH